jgi:methylenetetrahydrofolate reductase (NADPH)
VLVTQFGFAAAPLLAWEREMREAGVRLPVRVGLAGLAGVATLLRYAAVCGVAASTRTLLRQGGRMLRLTGALAPGRIVAAVARTVLDDAGADFRAFHFYPFGSLDATVDWAAAIAAGAFELDREGLDLVV